VHSCPPSALSRIPLSNNALHQNYNWADANSRLPASTTPQSTLMATTSPNSMFRSLTLPPSTFPPSAMLTSPRLRRP
jgi:hypothetical protein